MLFKGNQKITACYTKTDKESYKKGGTVCGRCYSREKKLKILLCRRNETMTTTLVFQSKKCTATFLLDQATSVKNFACKKNTRKKRQP